MIDLPPNRVVHILAPSEGKPSIPIKWKAKYGGLEVSELVWIKELESENSRLKRMYAELALENEAIKGLLKKL
jgi:hypothetical protein